MHLADHIRPLLRDHDCVIIPDFGGLVADVAPARLQPGRQVLSPPTKLVAFNQALTRNDGLLVDAVSQHLGVSLSQARDLVRQAVAQLRQELDEAHRTTLPGIGIFRRGTGRGLSFEYTGNDNLLPASYGLPELVARPVLANNARTTREKRPQPALRSGAQRGRLARVLPGAALGVVAALVLTASLLTWNNNASFKALAAYLPNWEWSSPAAAPAIATAPAVTMQEPQQATLAQHGWENPTVAEPTPTPAELERVPPVPVVETPAASVAAAPAAEKPVTPVAKPAPATPAPAKAEVAKTEPKAIVKEVEVAAPTAKPAVAKPAAPTSTTIKSRTGRFYVVAGAFSTLASAQKVRASHPNGRVILPPWGSRLYRLSVADFADRASAEKEAARLRAKAHSTNSHLVFPY